MVLPGLVWTLRQKRYATLALLMLVVAVGCAAAGTFEVHRLREKRSDNSRLIANAHAAAAPLTPALVPLTGGRPVDPIAVRYRTVTATGRYDAADQVYVGNRSQGGSQGFWVVTPLRSASGRLLVARGFVAAASNGLGPAHMPAPPRGSVRITGRLEVASGGASRFPEDVVSAIDPHQQAQKLGAPVFQAYLSLDAGQPGTAGLRALPGPSLSNPTGGASEWQLTSYVVQWYVFALLALAAPFLFARAEIRAARLRFLGLNAEDDSDLQVAPQRTALMPAQGRSSGADLAVRGRRGVARLSGVDAGVLRRAVRLADRYGLPLGPDVDSAGAAVVGRASEGPVRPTPAGPSRRRWGVPDLPDRTTGLPDRTDAGLARSRDDYHGSYNDHLWLLALADGAVPDAGRSGSPDAAPAAEGASGVAVPPTPPIRPPSRTIDGILAEPDQSDEGG